MGDAGGATKGRASAVRPVTGARPLAVGTSVTVAVFGAEASRPFCGK